MSSDPESATSLVVYQAAGVAIGPVCGADSPRDMSRFAALFLQALGPCSKAGQKGKQ